MTFESKASVNFAFFVPASKDGQVSGLSTGLRLAPTEITALKVVENASLVLAIALHKIGQYLMDAAANTDR